MKLADRPTPETDRNTWDADLRNMVVYDDIAKSLEQRLAHAVEALKVFAACDLNESNCASLDVANRSIRFVANKAITEIEEKK